MSDTTLILLAEDREADVYLIKKAFARGGISNPVFVVNDGEEAIAYLAGTGLFQNRREFPLPGLLLLDLKMPGLDGFDVLRWLREQPSLGHLLVIVLTSSDDIDDVESAYQLGVNSFLVKPGSFDNYVETCHILKQYWLNLNKFPETFRPPRPDSFST